MAFSNQNALKFYFRQLNELSTEKFFKGVSLKFEATSFGMIKIFWAKIGFQITPEVLQSILWLENATSYRDEVFNSLRDC